MEATTYWKNYKAANEWRKRHCIVWWKTRCLALEYENLLLRKVIRNLGKNQNNTLKIQENQHDNTKKSEIVSKKNKNDDGLEFYLDEDMMDFLAQSERHKRELQNKKKDESSSMNAQDDAPLEGTLAWVKKRSKDAELLYGNAGAKILAMETALQATIDKHKDKTKAQHWPNIPLKF